MTIQNDVVFSHIGIIRGDAIIYLSDLVILRDKDGSLAIPHSGNGDFVPLKHC